MGTAATAATAVVGVVVTVGEPVQSFLFFSLWMVWLEKEGFTFKIPKEIVSSF